MTNEAFEYDVAISFAERDKAAAGELADRLTGKRVSVFLDEYKSPGQWGANIVDHLVNLYARKARYCVLLISKAYPLQAWTERERTSARERALRDAGEFILPLPLDDAVVPGVSDAAEYQDLRQQSIESFAELLEEKLRKTKARSRPPSPSHDLRSGNIPDARRESKT